MVANLVPGQYQLNDTIMGRGTAYKVTAFDIQPYGVAAQDYQMPMEDLTRFGMDQITPGPINITISILKNRWISEKPQTGQYLINGSVGEIQKLWRADDIRYRWGEMQELYYCGADKMTKVIYGRTGKFTYPKSVVNMDGQITNEAIEVIGEFRRADTLCYSAEEKFVKVLQQAAPTTIFQDGDANSWVRIVCYGPITNPVITIGEQQIILDIDLAEDELAEVCSYPWRRRIVDSNGNNLRTALTGTNYLNKLIVPPQVPIPVRWTSDEINTFQPALGNKTWYESLDDIRQDELSDTFTQIEGKAVLGFDLFNKEIGSWYMKAGALHRKTAVVYNGRKYNTRDQVAYASIVEPGPGRIGVGLMSNEAMTNYIFVEANLAFNATQLLMRVGTGPHTWSSPKVTWNYTDGYTFKEDDIFGIKSLYNSGTGKTSYQMTFNGANVGSAWTDTDGLVTTTASNRSQVYLFNMDGKLFSHPVGIKDIVGYDTTTVPTPVGGVYVFWRDAYQVIE